MSQLSKDIRRNVKSGTQLPAKVIDTHHGKASVQLFGNGAILRDLDVIGGPVTKKQEVKVDFTTAKPTIVVISAPGVTQKQIDDSIAAKSKPSYIIQTEPETTIDIYHNDEFVATVTGINFVDGT